MTAKEAPPVHVIIDTREQQPYGFPLSTRAKLDTGDYSALGHESRMCVERKSKADIYGSLGGARDRFQREIERMSRMDFAGIVIEASLPDLLVPPAHTRMHPRAVIASIISWSERYRVHVYFAGDRPHGNALTLRLVEFYVEHFARRMSVWDENKERKVVTRIGDDQVLCSPGAGGLVAIVRGSKGVHVSAGSAPAVTMTVDEFRTWVVALDRVAGPRA